MKIDENIYNP